MSCHDPRSLKAAAERMAEELQKEQEQRKLLEDELKADLRTLTNANAAAAEQISKLEMDWQTASDAKAVAEAEVNAGSELSGYRPALCIALHAIVASLHFSSAPILPRRVRRFSTHSS